MPHDSIYTKCQEQADRSIETESRQEVAGGRERVLMLTGFCFWCGENVLELSSGDGYTTL